MTGVEIHPGATIGPHFVIDHGFGTVIGETAFVGSDCYFLQGVILGSLGISSNPLGKRHPTIGNRVEIGAFSKILGPVSIGDDVKISPGCLVNFDVDSNSRVLSINECQVINSRSHHRLEVYGISLRGDHLLCIHGEALLEAEIFLVDELGNFFSGVYLHVVERNEHEILFLISGFLGVLEERGAKRVMLLVKKDDLLVIVSRSAAVRRFLGKIKLSEKPVHLI